MLDDTRPRGECPVCAAIDAPSMTSASPEGTILLLCARTGLSADQAARLRQVAAGQVDWKLVVSFAAKHRLLPLLHRNLTTFCPEAMPASVARSLAARVAANADTASTLRQEMSACGSRGTSTCSLPSRTCRGSPRSLPKRAT